MSTILKLEIQTVGMIWSLRLMLLTDAKAVQTNAVVQRTKTGCYAKERQRNCWQGNQTREFSK